MINPLTISAYWSLRNVIDFGAVTVGANDSAKVFAEYA